MDWTVSLQGLQLVQKADQAELKYVIPTKEGVSTLHRHRQVRQWLERRQKFSTES